MKRILVIILTAGLALAAQAADGPFKPDWESLQAHKDPEWFRDAKFGIYTHWGPVTVGCEDAPKGGEWYGKEMYQTTSPIFAYHKQKFGDQHVFGYKDIIPLFTARKFDPDQWADLFARAGAKFAGPVAVHHDNFAMWDSAVTPWNSVKMGPHRDVTGELTKAYRAHGLRGCHKTTQRMPLEQESGIQTPVLGHDLKVITTFHHGYAWRYYEPAFQYDAADGKNFRLYTEPHHPKDPPSKRFQDQWLAMVMEVVQKYEPDMIWFDFELDKVITPEYQQKMFASYYNWAAAHGKESAVAHKFREIHKHTGIIDFERGREDKLVPYPWLTDTALGPWFNRNADKYRTTANIIHVLADIVSKNGCLLLNVGPHADGSIPKRAEKMLLEIGDWLKVNGEAIYSTRPWEVYGEGPTRQTNGGGFSERKDKGFTPQDIRFTCSKDGATLYAITLGLPTEPVRIRSLAGRQIGDVSLVGSAVRLKWKPESDALVIQPIAEWPSQYAVAFKIELSK